jgi:hypothetical protein
MSIVIAVANISRVVIKSDGLIEDAQTVNLKSSDYEQITNLNKDCMIGYYGDNDHCELIINEYKRLASVSNVDIDSLKPTTVIYDLCEISKALNDNNEVVSFIVAGKENNKIVLFGFTSNDEFIINNLTPEDDGHIKYITFGSDIQKSAMTFTKFHSAGRSIEQTMNQYIKYISSIDTSVNDVIYTRKIKL